MTASLAVAASFRSKQNSLATCSFWLLTRPPGTFFHWYSIAIDMFTSLPYIGNEMWLFNAEFTTLTEMLDGLASSHWLLISDNPTTSRNSDFAIKKKTWWGGSIMWPTKHIHTEAPLNSAATALAKAYSSSVALISVGNKRILGCWHIVIPKTSPPKRDLAFQFRLPSWGQNLIW